MSEFNRVSLGREGGEGFAEMNERYYLEAVDAYIEELYAEDTPAILEKQPSTTDPESLAMEKNIEAQFIADILPHYGISKEIVDKITEVEGEGAQAWELPSPQNFDVPELPLDYAYSGGVARSGLLRALGIDNNAGYRDMDIVRFGGSEEKTKQDLELERKYMPEDSSHGYGIQNYRKVDQYLVSRDLTISELFMDRDGIVFTPKCLLDTVRGIVRLSDYERKILSSDKPKTKILAKAVRIYAQGISEHKQIHLDAEVVRKLNEKFILTFYQALHFVRALEHSENAGMEYIRLLKENNALPSQVDTIEKCVAYYSARLRDKTTFFRKAPHLQRIFEKNLLAETSVELESELYRDLQWENEDYGALDLKDPIMRKLAVEQARKHLELPDEQKVTESEETELDRALEDFADSGRKRFRLR